MIITFYSKLWLRQTLCHWKAKTKIYNFVFHKKFPIPTFWGSKRAGSNLRSQLVCSSSGRTQIFFSVRKWRPQLVCSSSGRTWVVFLLRKCRPQLVRSWSGRNTVHSLINRLERDFSAIFPIFLLSSVIFSLLSHRVYTQTLGKDLRKPPNTFLTPGTRFLALET